MKRIQTITFLSFLLAVSIALAGNEAAGEKADDTNDAWVHTKVKAELVGEGSANINIEVNNGTVQLAGFVESEEQREAAEKAAASVEGVKQVSNQLQVQTAAREGMATVDDGMVASKVKAKLAETDATNGFDINVEVRNGVVLLSGFVESDTERTAAIDAARSIDGVVDVINGMDLITSAA